MGVSRPAFFRWSKHTYNLSPSSLTSLAGASRRREEEEEEEEELEEEEPPCHCHVTAVKRAGGRADGFMDEGLIWFMPPITFLVARRPAFLALHGILLLRR